MTNKLDSLLKMFFEIEKRAGSEEAEKWLAQEEIDLSPAEVRKAEKMLAELEMAEA